MNGLAAPSAAFTTNVAEGCAPLEVSFTDESTNEPTSWTWLFEGAEPSTSNEQNPVVTYNEAGTFSVTLSVSNTIGNNVINMPEVIIISAAPTASFDFEGSEGFISFTSTSERANTYAWDFGDGEISDEQNPVHNYASAGDYIVTLTTTNECGSTTETIEVNVEGVNAVQDLAGVSNFNLFPNPNAGKFTMLLEGEGRDNVSISFLNVLGQELQVYEVDFGAGYLNREFNLSGFANGVYFARLTIDGQAEYHKFVIEK